MLIFGNMKINGIEQVNIGTEEKPFYLPKINNMKNQVIKNLNTEMGKEIIELPKQPEFKRGDKVLVWDYKEDEVGERIFLTYIEGAECPFTVVHEEYEAEFNGGEIFATDNFKNCKYGSDFKSSCRVVKN